MAKKMKMKKYDMGGGVTDKGKGKGVMDRAASAVRAGVKKYAPAAAPVLQSGYNKAASIVDKASSTVSSVGKSLGKSMGMYKKGGMVGKSKKK
jgi:hypothetical protein